MLVYIMAYDNILGSFIDKILQEDLEVLRITGVSSIYESSKTYEGSSKKDLVLLPRGEIFLEGVWSGNCKILAKYKVRMPLGLWSPGKMGVNSLLEYSKFVGNEARRCGEFFEEDFKVRVFLKDRIPEQLKGYRNLISDEYERKRLDTLLEN